MFLNRKTPTAQMRDILNKEQNFILSGQIDKLDKFTQRKEALIAKLTERDKSTSADELEDIRKIAKRNLTLITAAKNGLNSVRTRLEEMKKVSSGAQTYGRNGSRQTLDSSTPKKTISY